MNTRNRSIDLLDHPASGDSGQWKQRLTASSFSSSSSRELNGEGNAAQSRLNDKGSRSQSRLAAAMMSHEYIHGAPDVGGAVWLDAGQRACSIG
ncbi:hypothetical protein CBOM_07979 [Ceraceosorus bombacis]|uniref:Uncharacterized protein n=1 Tax=Ceraceosorus bombacis TaxID=401625 RepID=A0A0P1BSG7_9BASI|nr:hypothetical protein CBOM_07979 [Ceraceosorus bombacis]